jgi:hypothetical protein
MTITVRGELNSDVSAARIDAQEKLIKRGTIQREDLAYLIKSRSSTIVNEKQKPATTGYLSPVSAATLEACRVCCALPRRWDTPYSRNVVLRTI